MSTADHISSRATREALLDRIPALALDIESDGQAIFQIGLRRKGKLLAVDARRQPGAIAKFIQQLAGLPRGTLLIGHNLKEWDLLILRRHGLETGRLLLWDTLRIEALLNPRLAQYSLQTTHRAKDDAELTWRLFCNQLSRLYRPEVHRALRSAEIPRDFLARHVDPIFQATAAAADAPDLSALEKERDAMLGIAAGDNSLLQPLQALRPASARPRHLLFPEVLLPYLKALPKAVFYGPEDDPAYHEVDPEKLQSLAGDRSYEADLLRAYLAACRRQRQAPLVGCLPEWLRRKISRKFAVGEYATPRRYRPPAAGSSGEVVHCFPAGGYPAMIDAANDPAQAEPDIILLYPEIDRITAQYELQAKPAALIDRALQHLHIWAKFSCGRSFYRVEAAEKAAILQAFGQEENRPAGMDNLWIEKTLSGSYILRGNYRDLKAAIRSRLPGAVIREVAFDQPGRKAGGEIHYASLKIPPRRKADPDTLLLNPETRYRDRYWTALSFMVKELSRNRPSVLFVASAPEVSKLSALFRQLGFFIPEHPALQRRIELLRQSQHPQRMVILPYHQLLPWIEKPDTNALQIIIESLPLQEQWVLNPGIAPAPAGQEAGEMLPEADDAADETPPDGAHSADAAPENGAPPATRPELLRHDPLAALSAMLPLLQLMTLRRRDAGEEGRLVILDSRLQPYRALAGKLPLQPLHLPVWKSPETYRQRLAEVQIYLQNLQPESNGFLEADWLGTFQNIFIGGQAFREEQQRYLQKIMPREQDILVTLPTGGGKSVLFQAPALYRGLHTHRLTLVVSPLKALMVDQAEALWRKGFWNNVEAITGDMPRFEIRDIYRRLAGGELSLLFVAPERFRSKEFLKALNFRLAADGAPEFWVFDEAHCISQWGLDFRPDYLRAVSYIQQERKNGAHAPVILLSATVTEQVFSDLERVFS